MVVGHDAHERHDDAPGHHDGREPYGWSDLFEYQVAGDLKGGVGEEEGGETPVVLVGCEGEVLLEAFDFCVANVAAWEAFGQRLGLREVWKVRGSSGMQRGRTVEEGEEIEQGQHGDETHVHLGNCQQD